MAEPLSHIIPALGRVKIEALRKAHVDRLYAELLRGGLAPSSVRRVHAVLHAALEEAVQEDLIPRNPAAHATKPKVRQEEIEPLDAQNVVNRSFKPLLRRAGLPSIRFHDLRHTCATLLLAKGVHPKLVQALLGHASIGITMDLYSHWAPAMGDQAAAAMEDVLQKDRTKAKNDSDAA